MGGEALVEKAEENIVLLDLTAPTIPQRRARTAGWSLGLATAHDIAAAILQARRPSRSAERNVAAPKPANTGTTSASTWSRLFMLSMAPHRDDQATMVW